MDFPLLAKQREFVLTGTDAGLRNWGIPKTTREILYSGAVGAGKSLALCCWLVANAVGRPGTRHALFRKTNASLAHTTLATLLEGEGDVPPVLPPGSYRHNKSLQYIDVDGGGRILYMGLDVTKRGKTPQKRGGLNLNSAAIDEASEISLNEFLFVKTRLRQRSRPVKGLPDRPQRTVALATNPDSPEHWIYKRFFEDKYKNAHAITCRSSDNEFLPADYLEELDSYVGQMRERYVLGHWVAFEGLVYDSDYWDNNLNVLTYDAENKLYRNGAGHTWTEDAFKPMSRVGGDYGFTDPTALEGMQLDGDGRVFISKEFYEEGKTHKQVGDVAKSWGVDRARWVMDSAEAGLIKAMKDRGLNCVGVKKGPDSIMRGCNLMRDRMKPAGDGIPRLLVSDECVKFLKERGCYKLDDKKDLPLDEYNHAMDAARYGIMDLDSGSTSRALV